MSNLDQLMLEASLLPTSAANVQELLDLVFKMRRQLLDQKGKIDQLEAQRPFWAKGYSSESIAAQTLVAALSQLWAIMGVTSQTEAVLTLKSLTNKPALQSIQDSSFAALEVVT